MPDKNKIIITGEYNEEIALDSNAIVCVRFYQTASKRWVVEVGVGCFPMAISFTDEAKAYSTFKRLHEFIG